MTATKTIAGRKVTLETGRSYVAGRSIATRRDETFDVRINDASDLYGKPALVVPGLTYQQANAFLNKFNAKGAWAGQEW